MPCPLLLQEKTPAARAARVAMMKAALLFREEEQMQGLSGNLVSCGVLEWWTGKYSQSARDLPSVGADVRLGA